MKPLPAPNVPGKTEYERFENALRRVLTVLQISLICLFALTALGFPRSTQSNPPHSPPHNSSKIFRGSWTASAGPTQIFRGAWSAETSAHNSNSAVGSWTLTNDANEIILEGTWSAQKAAEGWQGTWTARTRNGRSLSGTWNADLPDLGRERSLGQWRLGRERRGA